MLRLLGQIFRDFSASKTIDLDVLYALTHTLVTCRLGCAKDMFCMRVIQGRFIAG